MRFENERNINNKKYTLVSRDYENSDTSKFYGTKINLSHLIDELGHAWAAQKGEFEQDEKGNFTMSIGTAKSYNKVDRKNKTVEETGIDGLYIEEALNSIEEEKSLYRLFEINDYHDIPGYIPSKYQGIMTDMMRYYTEKLGKTAFEKARVQKDRSEIEKLQEIFDETSFIKDAQVMNKIY